MSWLLREDDVLAAVEERRPGWQSALTGAILMGRPAVVQTVTRSAAVELDVAWCVPDEIDSQRHGYRVKSISALAARRLSLPRIAPGVLVIAPGGSFERWNLSVGDCLEVRGE